MSTRRSGKWPTSTALPPRRNRFGSTNALLQEPSVKNLIPEIRRDEGLQDPITVRHDTWQVIEGNSRLAAYRKLAEESDGDQWTHIRCLVVTSLTDDQQTRLLGQAHLHGKTDWSPYAKALFCFRWVVEENRDVLLALQSFRDLRRRDQEERRNRPTHADQW